ncbi:energy transducer TonB [Sphingomonas hankookensis]|uniref:energy transducer TonB n=1 Tax=Sphingomonas hankookensis TaxID=563996 RepID=UPI001F55ECD1|nr:energy transducer TonB [Sphingomonas hankookensis]
MPDPILHGLLAMVQAAAPAPAPQTLQAQFDAANAAYVQKRCPDALKLYDALDRRTAGSKNAVFRGAIAVRRGICLVRTGEGPAGIASIRAGLPVLAANPQEFAPDLTNAHLAMGDAAFDAFDYDGAAAAYRDALAIARGTERVIPLLALARSHSFDHDGKALGYAEEARRLVMADTAIDKQTVAAVQTRYARVLFNEGRAADAYTVLKDSLRKQGGLDVRVNLSEIATRADLAQAALLNGDREKARTYLAYTGAGRMEKAPFAGAREMATTPCGGVAGIKPNDVAVIEFSLGDDGIVRNVAPIYTTGNRAAALAFARTVADWSWAPVDAVAIPAFWRQSARVELRCSNAAERPRPTAPLDEAVAAWLTSQGSPEPSWSELPSARALPQAQAARTATKPIDRLRANIWLLGSELVDDQDSRPIVAEALAQAQAMRAPLPVLARLQVHAARVEAKDYPGVLRSYRALLQRADIAADPLSAGTIRMILAGDVFVVKPAERSEMVDAVLASPLPDRHPLKVAALLTRADLSAQRGDVAAAQAAFTKTGLSSDQCALIAPMPAVQRAGWSSDSFPQEAQAMGFEGWAKVEYDIAADGHTMTPRTIAAYPPFVFGDAAQKIIGATRYRSSFRPESDTACTGNATRIVFNLPR